MNDEQDIAFNSFNNFVINTKNKVLDQTYKSRTSIYLFIIRPLKAVLYIIINEWGLKGRMIFKYEK